MQRKSSSSPPSDRGGSNEINAALVSVIAELLELDPAEIRAHSQHTFVQLGGSSIKALQLTFKLETCGLKLDLESILAENNTLEVLSKLLKPSDHVDKEKHGSPASAKPFELIPSSSQQSILDEAAEQIGCPSSSVQDILPLTAQQKALWLGSLKQPGTYISHWQYALPERWDSDRLKTAWQSLVQQTPSLRMRVIFGPDDNLYQALVAPNVLDGYWIEHNSSSRNHIVPEYGSLLAASGLESQTSSRTFHVHAHHLLYDRWSMQMVMEDLRTLYHNPDGQLSRPSFVPFLRPAAESEHEDLVAEWKSALGDASLTPAPKLVQSSKPPHASERLHQSIPLQSGSWATQAELITAAWSLVCSKHSNSQDISFGLTLWGRDVSVPSVTEMVFPTFSTLPFCSRQTSGETVTELLRRTRSSLATLRRVQTLGLDTMSQINDASRQACQFNSIVVVQPELDLCSKENGEIVGPGELLSWDVQQTQPLLVECTPVKGQISCSLQYDARFLPTSIAEALLSHFCIAVDALSACDDTICDEIDLFAESDAERVRKWVVPCEALNDGKLHQIIEEQAKLTPHSDALWCTDATLTYAQMMKSASTLAKQLRAQNTTGNVGFCLEKSALAVIAMIGINMAGCAFVPMDPSHPPGRLAQIVEDADMSLLLCSTSLCAKFGDFATPTLVLNPSQLLDSQNAAQGDAPDASKCSNNALNNETAYIIYTSGSTGRPKGVVIAHKQVCTSVSAMVKTFGFSPRTRALQFSSYAFDACIMEVYATLAAGGVVCVPSDAERMELDEFIRQCQPTFSILTTSVALTLSDESMAQLSRLVLTGEPLSKGVLQKAFDAGTEVWCGYGPTETTVIVTGHRFTSPSASPTTIGRSFSSTAWIVNSQDPHKLAPIGVPGQLAFSGHTLASGYYNDDEKTEKVFKRNLEWTKAFPNLPLERVYLTGDSVCHNHDGTIEFLGRAGGYTKIAGNRVDLAEIEHVLRHKGGLAEVSVQICQIQGSHESRELLVCFFVDPSCRDPRTCGLLDLTPDARAKASEARSTLKDSLPSYMMPSAFLLVTSIPSSPISGKLDKDTLLGLVKTLSVECVLTKYGLAPSDDTNSNGTADSETTGPNGHVDDEREALLKDAWARVLDVTASSLHSQSHFFRMGGDSLRAMKLAASLRRAGASLPVAEIFKAPMLQSMANALQLNSKELVQRRRSAAQPTNESQDASLIQFAAQTLNVSKGSIESFSACLSLQVQMLVASERTHDVFFHRECFEIRSDIPRSEVSNVCRRLMGQNELLRTRMFIHGPSGRFLQAVLDCETAFEMNVSDLTLEQYLNRNPTSAMGLTTALCQFTMLESGDQRLLVWETHHSIFDGHSRLLLIDRMQNLVAQQPRNTSHNQEHAPESPDGSFQDFIRYIESCDKRRAHRFWSEYLDGTERLNLSILRPTQDNPPTNASAAKTVEVTWEDAAFTSATHIRAAFAMVLAQYAGRPDVNFAATVNGRDLPVDGIEEIAGPTFSTIPVRVKVKWDDPPRTLLSRIQQDFADCLMHQSMATEEIRGLTASCEKACDFRCHLLIQPAESGLSYEKLSSLGYHALPAVQTMSLQIPFNIVATAADNHVKLEAIYSNAAITSREVELFLDQMGTTLKQMSTPAASQTVGDVVGMGELNAQVLTSLQPSSNARSSGTSIPSLVFRGMNERANNEALHSSNLSLTYQDVYDLSHQFARCIGEKVTTPKQVLAMCLPKTPWAIIAQLAILIAGHAYVPIDPEWPATRSKDIIEQTKSALILTTPMLADTLRPHDRELLVLDESVAPNTSDRSQYPEIEASDAAYVLFTSGSTGTAKGVVVEHGSICLTLQEYARRLDFTTRTRALLFASFTFDASVMETWSVLAAGGTLCIANDDERIGDLVGFINRAKCDCVALTPTAAGLVEPQQLPSVKTMLFCGEKSRASDVKRWEDGSAVLVNAYGPAEVSVNAAMNTDFRNTDLDDVGVSMGGGLWIVEPDNCDRILPVGCIGELMISGPVLARGYLNAPEMTAQKFVRPRWPDWAQMGNDRAYMTGDLARIDVQGRLHFVGRNDGQMKVNGVRIEAGEIEHAVHQSGVDIKDAMAGSILRHDRAEVALYFVPDDSNAHAGPVRLLPLTEGYASTISAMHKSCVDALPASHVPTVYVPASAIPLTASGKADRKMLSHLASSLHHAQLDLYRPFSGTQQVNGDDKLTQSTSTSGDADNDRPLTETENTLKSMWEAALPHSRQTAVTADSHFMHSGGDSIAAIRLAAAAKSKDMHLPVSTIYANPRLRDMAKTVASRPDLGARSQSVQSPAAFEMLDDLVLSPGQDAGIANPEPTTNGVANGDANGDALSGSKSPDYFGRKAIPSASRTLADCLHPESAEPAFIISGNPSRTISHASLAENVTNLQQALASQDLGRGKKVSIVLENPQLFAVTFLATTLQSCIAAPLNRGFTAQEFEYYYEDFGAEVVILSSREFEDQGSAYAAAKAKGLQIAVCSLLDGQVALRFPNHNATVRAEQDAQPHRPDADDVALVLHTSGTTGKPKAVPLTHANIAASVSNIIAHYSLTSDDRTLLVMPLFHVHGLVAALLSPLASGGACILPSSYGGGLTPAFFRDAVEHQATWYTATPTLHRLALQIPMEKKHTFRFVRSCSSPLDAATFRQLQERYGCPIVEAYAMTEAAHQVCSNPVSATGVRQGSVGKPTGVEVKILNEAGDEVEAGAVGEVCIRGVNVMNGYLDRAEANATSFVAHGFFRTGDQGKIDADGYVQLTGRIKELINKGGEKLSPVEIDNAISQHEHIAEAVSFAIPDEMYGEEVGAAVVVEQGRSVDEADVKAWVAQRLTQAKVPKKVYFLDVIPKTAVGKMQRSLVAKSVASNG